MSAEDVKKVENLEDAHVEGLNPAGAPTNLDPNHINEDLEDSNITKPYQELWESCDSNLQKSRNEEERSNSKSTKNHEFSRWEKI